MAIQRRYSAFHDLGQLFLEVVNLSSQSVPSDSFREKLLTAKKLAEMKNPWFTEDNINFRLKSLGEALLNISEPPSLPEESQNSPKTIGQIPGSQIPLQGLETLFFLLTSGNSVKIKPAKEDEVLIKFVVEFLRETKTFPEAELQITERMNNTDAMIISSEEKTLPFYEKYFGHLPHLFRTRKWSAALLDSSASDEELKETAAGIFRFFGWDNRNIHKLYLPEGFDTNRLFEAFFHWDSVMENNRYMNNYEYHRTLFLLEDLSFLDNNFLILREQQDLKSPVGVVHFEIYKNFDEVQAGLESQKSILDQVYGKGFSRPLGSVFHSDLSFQDENAEIRKFLQNLNSPKSE